MSNRILIMKNKDKEKQRKKKQKFSISFLFLFTCSLVGNFVALLTFYSIWRHSDISTLNTTLNLSELRSNLSRLMFGQKEAINLLIDEMSKYLNNEESYATFPAPLMISVHGSSGTGKTKLTNHLIEFLPKGCTRKFIIPLHFPQRSFSYEVLNFSSNNCPVEILIFEEMDFASDLFLNALKINLNVFYFAKKSMKTVILFTSTQGTNSVVNYVINKLGNNLTVIQKEVSERIRDSLRSRELNPWIKFLRFYQNDIVFITFYPLEKEHVRKCIVSQLNELGNTSGKIVNFILENVNFLPKDQHLIAENGCKQIDTYIKFYSDSF